MSAEPRKRPLIICDADEVLLRFLSGLEDYLPGRGLYLDVGSYALTGNIKEVGTDRPLEQREVGQLLKGFYLEEVENLQAVQGAAAALKRLSVFADIVILTNVAESVRDGRIANLRALGMDFPVIANTGPKGSVVKKLAEEAGGPVFFIDDIAPHHASVAEVWPDTHQIHFIADPRLFRLATPSPHARLFSNDWTETADHIAAALHAADNLV